MKKRVLALALSLTLTFSLSMNVFASKDENKKVNDVSTEELQAMNDFITEYAPYAKKAEGDKEVKEAWEIAKSNNVIFVNSEEYLELQPKAREVLPVVYEKLEKSIAFCNDLIDMKLVKVDTETIEIKSLELTQESLDAIDEYSTSSYILEPYSGSHCEFPGLHVNILTDNNMYEILEFMSNCGALAMENTYALTVSYWIGKVRNNGEWDYKVTGVFGYDQDLICCTYMHGTNVHKTCEWLGNYNYGYTGSALFPLPILETGSFAVSGFDKNDIYTDWPVIKEGFNDSFDYNP